MSDNKAVLVSLTILFVGCADRNYVKLDLPSEMSGRGSATTWGTLNIHTKLGDSPIRVGTTSKGEVVEAAIPTKMIERGFPKDAALRARGAFDWKGCLGGCNQFYPMDRGNCEASCLEAMFAHEPF